MTKPEPSHAVSTTPPPPSFEECAAAFERATSVLPSVSYVASPLAMAEAFDWEEIFELEEEPAR
jgi:hypothetical protein